MKLILTRTVENLGVAGDVVNVKPGYGRNYLLPQGLAYVASEANMKRIEAEQVRASERARRDYLEAKRQASHLDGMELTFTARAGEEGKLFGSITNVDIATRLAAAGLDFEVDRRRIQIEDPIKSVGDFNVPVRLHAEVEAVLVVHVVAEDAA